MTIRYEEMSKGPVEVCRDLCNALMAHQAAKGNFHPEILKHMTFETRLKADFEAFNEKFLLVAFDDDRPIGYIFDTAMIFTEAMRNDKPAFTSQFSTNSQWLFPEWLEPNTKIATLDNLYVSPEYRGQHVGSTLIKRGMQWLKQDTKAENLFVYVSNGNDPAPLYESLGFKYSHDVLDGFIEAYVMAN